jgi:hypothetical protein
MSASRRVVRILGVLALLASSGMAQSSDSRITFSLDFPNSEPEHYTISVDGSGRSSYESDAKLTDQSEEKDIFHLDFALSAGSRDRVFDLAKRARYFQGDLETKIPNLAFTGKKTLSYKDGQKSTQATYNYSAEPAVQELTTFFQRLSVTLEFGRQLQYYYRYQKLALDDELKQIEEMSQDNQLSELAAIAPILQQISNDASVMRVARARSLRLLSKIRTESAGK